MWWLALLGMHLIGLVGFNLILRHSVLQKIDQFTLAAIMQTGITIPAVFLLIIFPPDIASFSAKTYLFLSAATIVGIFFHVANVRTLQYLEASVYSIIYNLRIIITTALGIIFLNENIVGLRIAGGLLILFAIIIVKQKGSKSARLQGIFWGVMSASALSFLNMFEKLLINDIGYFNYFPLLAVITFILMWSYYLLKNKKIDLAIFKRPNMGKLMLFRAISAYGFSGALGAGALISVGNYISGMSVIIMILAGMLLLNERDNLKRKFVSAIVAVTGLTLVLFSSLL